ncbi:hypothetical protein NB063_29250 [Rhodopirellula sp. ICT_H3.1]|uniref:Uncharacterized protein n=2 Tax=Aporhodopirellula aestuarii TaxID=2950107 RepID=A0ABT0UCT5_9BACT|nr:hypothetical protein [Aporhodopirellula aestuarii]
MDVSPWSTATRTTPSAEGMTCVVLPRSAPYSNRVSLDFINQQPVPNFCDLDPASPQKNGQRLGDIGRLAWVSIECDAV